MKIGSGSASSMGAAQAALPVFRPLEYADGYLPIRDHGLIGDGGTAALVGRDGSVSWLCLPRFDSPPVFARLLDAARGGEFALAPEGTNEARQYYEPDTAVLVTEMRTESGLVRLTDALLLRRGSDLTEDIAAGRDELQRTVRVLQGRARVRVGIAPLGETTTECRGDGLRLRISGRQDLDLQLWSSRSLTGLRDDFDLREGEELVLTLGWDRERFFRRATSPASALEETSLAWRRWISRVRYDGPEPAAVRRSAITMKLLDHFESGAMVAAPTSSLPESIGGERNWDYRYGWIRDAAFGVYAFRRIGLHYEADGFLGWVLGAIEAHGRPRVLYTLDGEIAPRERTDPKLAGYRGSSPVRWGNAASDQRQHDVYGEVLDCAFQWQRYGGEVSDALWAGLRRLAERARGEWRKTDRGIWEVRTGGRPFTYSAALCHVALDRASRMASARGLEGDVERWRQEAERIRSTILEEAWNPQREAFTEALRGSELDAAVLALPLRRVVPAQHPRMKATVDAIVRGLGAGPGLLYRYLPERSPDGLPGKEGAFLICSFWLVENLALQGRLTEASDLFQGLCGRAGPLGLLPEQIDPGTGAFLGNYPLAISHVGLIAAGARLSEIIRGKEAAPSDASAPPDEAQGP